MGSNHGLRELGGGGQEDTTLNAGLPAAEGGREGLSESPLVSISKNPLTVFSKFYFAESTPLLILWKLLGVFRKLDTPCGLPLTLTI